MEWKVQLYYKIISNSILNKRAGCHKRMQSVYTPIKATVMLTRLTGSAPHSLQANAIKPFPGPPTNINIV